MAHADISIKIIVDIELLFCTLAIATPAPLKNEVLYVVAAVVLGLSK
jgi:hypothetical protein